MKLLVCIAVLCSLALYVRAFPNGAPLGACSTLAPNPGTPGGHNAQPQATEVPYTLNLTAFMNGGVLSYSPGMTYNLHLYGTGDPQPQFRGFLVQARQVSDDNNIVGTFGNLGGDVQGRACPTGSGDINAVTHTNNNNKTLAHLEWTAPSTGVGNIRFGFAVVQETAIYWANERTVEISGAAAVTVTMGTLLSMAVLAMIKLF